MLKLIGYNEQNFKYQFWLSIKAIIAIHPQGDGARIECLDGKTYLVAQTAEQIMAMPEMVLRATM